MKQSKLRKRRVWRYAVLYFTMFIVFLALILGPIFTKTQILNGTSSIITDGSKTYWLMQPINQNNNNTRNRTETGTGLVSGAATTSAASTGAARIRLF